MGFAYFLYKSVPVGLILTGAMPLKLLLGAPAAMLTPLALQCTGCALAIGSSKRSPP
ncbi:MAG: hypothetical protein FD134_903 [Gallionellaceae bacterium]|nr:MAG: hypothetical protein FD134_903 [Gallionellaceae bacterium]